MHDLQSEWLERFQSLMDRAGQLGLHEPTATVLATADSRGRPSARVVLIRRWDEAGFVFYTNSQSRKGCDLSENPCAALCLHWDQLQEQVRIEGPVSRVPDEEADVYWQRRARASQVGAWASQQSQPLAARQELEDRVRRYEEEFRDREVPRPEHWTGYRVTPQRIEFWQNREARLHERTLYERVGNGWQRSHLYP